MAFGAVRAGTPVVGGEVFGMRPWVLGAVRGTPVVGGPIFGMRPWAFGAVRGFALGGHPPPVWGGLYLPEGVGLPVVAPRWV